MNPHYLCHSNNKEWQTRKGWVYVREGQQLIHYSTRYQTRLLNAPFMLMEPGLFTEITPDANTACDCDGCRELSKAAGKPF